jgi:AraC family transcriptional regulator
MSIDNNAIAAIANAIDFMENSLKEEIGISDAADAASYSLYHFCRLFNRYVHHGPYDYLIRRRLTEAARELKITDRQIIDIAFDYQFNSHETFCRAFKRFTGMSPKEWRKKGIQDRRFTFSRRTLKHLELIGGGILVKPEFRECRGFTLAGISSMIKPEKNSENSLWCILEKEYGSIRNIVRPIVYYCIRTYPSNWEKDGIIYMAAVEVKTFEEVNPILTLKVIPSGTYAVFSASGPYQPAFDYLYQTYLPKSGRSPAYPLEIERRGHDLRQTDQGDDGKKYLIPVI